MEAFVIGVGLTLLWVVVEHSIQYVASVSGVQFEFSIDQLDCQSRRKTGCGQEQAQTGTHKDEMGTWGLCLSPTTSELTALGDRQEIVGPSPQRGTCIWSDSQSRLFCEHTYESPFGEPPK